MNRKFKRFVAILLSAAMVCGSSMMVLADEPTHSGSFSGDAAEVEGYVDKDVFTYRVPTASNNALKMILDPQGLIAATHAAAYDGFTDSDFEAGKSVFFHRYETGATKTFMGTSDSLSACNLGTVSMNVTVDTEIENVGSITFVSSDAAYTASKTPAIKFVFKVLAVPTGETTLQANDELIVSANGTEIKKVATVSSDVVSGVKNQYEVSYNGIKNGKKDYTYEVPSANKAAVETAVAADKFQFCYEADANDVKGWGDILDANPKIKLTYKFEKKTDDEDVTPTAIASIISGTGQVFIRLVDGQNAVAAKVTSVKVDGNATSNYTVAGSGAIIVNSVAAGSHKFTIVHDGTTYEGTGTAN